MLVNERIIHLLVIASRESWLIQRRPLECSSQIRPFAESSRVVRAQCAINCFEDEVSSQIRKDECDLRMRVSPPFLFIYLTSQRTISDSFLSLIKNVHTHIRNIQKYAKICKSATLSILNNLSGCLFYLKNFKKYWREHISQIILFKSYYYYT